MKVGIVGVGKVGSAVAFGLAKIGHAILKHDVKLGTSINDVLPAPIIFICVPTPMLPNGRCETGIVETVLAQLNVLNYAGLVVIKSTVIPGSTDSWYKRYALRLAFCPEFLRERSATTDFIENHDVCIAGVYEQEDADLIREAHGSLPKVFTQVRPIEAELAKYFSNVFNAMRVVFACQFHDVCEALGVNYTNVKSAVVCRHNIGDYYLDCNALLRSFGGACLPKDTEAFANLVMDLGVDAPLFKAIVNFNERLSK